MKSQTRLLLTFIAGAAAGVAVTYLLTSEKGEDLLNEFNAMARKVRDSINERMGEEEAAGAAAGTEEDFMGV